MHIRTYFFSSFLVHAVFLIYLLSLPLDKPIIQPGSYKAYFVSLQREGNVTPRIPYHSTKPVAETTIKAKDAKIASEAEEIHVSQDAMGYEAKKEIISEKEPEPKAKEIPVEKPVQVAEVKEPEELQKVTEAPKKEASALEEKKQETPKNEVPETKIAIKETAPLVRSPNLSKVDKNEFLEKQGITILPPQEKLREKSIDVAKLKINEETAVPQKIEEPLKEIPEGDKPDTREAQRIEAEKKSEADVSDTKESSFMEKKPSTEERVSSPDVKKVAGLEEIKNVLKANSPVEQNNIVRAIPEKVPSGTSDKGKPGATKGKSRRAGSDKNLVPSPQGLKEEALLGKVQAETRVPGSTLAQTKQSSQEGYSPGQDEGKQQPIIHAKQEGEGKSDIEDKTSFAGIPISEALVPSDLKIEVSLRKPSTFHSEPVIKKVPLSADATKQDNMPKATEITEISLEESGDGIKVRITCNGSMTPKVFPLDKNRIVIDLPKVSIKAPLPSNVVSHLKEIRSGRHKDKSRLVLELDEKMPFDVSSSGNTVIVAMLKHKNKPDPAPVEQKAQEEAEPKELKETDISNISMHLLKNPHPKSNQKGKRVEVTLLEGKKEAHSGDKSTVKRAFSVLRTAEGAYTFIVKNEENAAYETDLAFLIFQGKKGERTKNFRAVRLSPQTSVRFKFLLPEAIFWDDEEYFSGKIENSETMTKFNEKTGIVWKEIKNE